MTYTKNLDPALRNMQPIYTRYVRNPNWFIARKAKIYQRVKSSSSLTFQIHPSVVT